MTPPKFIYWHANNGYWLGYLQDYRDYMTQGSTLDELKENLKDIYGDIKIGLVPIINASNKITTNSYDKYQFLY